MRADNLVALSVDILIAGYTIAEAADGIQAVNLARRHRPQCVFLDLGMPGKDGFTVARELRLDPRTRAAHIHCLTGRMDHAAREKARSAGCEMYLTKPVNTSELLEVVQQQVKRGEPEWVTGLNLTEARDLMDWLENHGCTQLAVDCRGEEGFAVRCTCPQGQRLGRDAGGRVCLLPA
jgi:CheY-like chemotaxis protein